MRKAVGIALSTVLVAVVVTTVIVAALPQARVALAPVARYVPAIGSAAGQTFRIEGYSMEPGYQDGEQITLLPLAGGRPKLCDVVGYHTQQASNFIFFKRVVAIGPATVTWTLGSIEVNGAPACPAYLHAGSTGSGSKPTTVSVPAGMYFIVGDNLLDSADSRFSGPITRQSIVGYLPA